LRLGLQPRIQPRLRDHVVDRGHDLVLRQVAKTAAGLHRRVRLALEGAPVERELALRGARLPFLAVLESRCSAGAARVAQAAAVLVDLLAGIGEREGWSEQRGGCGKSKSRGGLHARSSVTG